MNLQSFANKKNREMKDNDTNTSNFFENPIFINPGIKKDTEKSFQTFDTNKFKKIDNADSSDLSEFVSKSMNVVVDIHREYKEEKHIENIKQNKTAHKKDINISIQESDSFKIFSETNTFYDKMNKRPNIDSIKRDSFQKGHNDINITDSLDLIEEFEDSPINKKDETKLETMIENGLIEENIDQLPVKEELYNKKQWAMIKNRVEGPKKPPRKRWLKDTHVIRLPEARNVPWNKMEQSLPAVQRSLQTQKLPFGYHNEAFISENEEILRIETDHNQDDTKIELKEIVNEYLASGNQSSQDASCQRKTSKEATFMNENLNKSMNLNGQQFEGRTKKMIQDTERFSGFDYDMFLNNRTNHRSTNKKEHFIKNNKRDVSINLKDISQNLDELTIRSNDHSSEESSLNDQSLINKKTKRKDEKRYIVDEGQSKQPIVSATEDDYFKKDCLRHFSQHASIEDDNLDENHIRKSSQCTISTTEGNDSDKDHSKETYYKQRKNEKKCTKYQHRAQTKKGKKKSLRKNVSSSSMYTLSPYIKEESKKKKKKNKPDTKYISITIHRADMLKIDYITKHPMVKIHIVKAANGNYLKCENGESTYLYPIITRKFDFKENKSIIPMWEEELIFEHNFDALLKMDDEQVVILFEFIDLLSFSEASFNYDKLGHEGCWYKIAWAFLKPVGRNNVLHIDKKVRLQLYKPQKCLKKFDSFNSCEVYSWWKSNIREKYPSSLFVTITSIDSSKLQPLFYQQLPLYDLSKASNESQKVSVYASNFTNLPKWTRLDAESCKIPNEIFFNTDTSENGCFYITFSNNGKYLACSFCEEHDYPIIIYEVETKKIDVRFSGHKAFIYSLDWSNDDNYLLSVSSDQTARIWDVQNQIVQHIEMMPHPSYVYCGKFDPENPSILATGCYDRIARIWIQDRKSKNHDLSQELEGHDGFVNSMCFQKNSNLLTADSLGIIIIWVIKKNRRLLSRKEWHISRKIRVRDIDGIIINTIILHPLEFRLLVHSRNNELRMLDLATGVVLQKYNELNNQRIQSTACISPCGGLILCGGEDSSLNVWNLETGNLLAKYTFDRNFRAVTCVDYHPYEHVLAFSTFGSPAPVRVLRFNKNASGEDIGLKMMGGIGSTINNSDISVRFLNAFITPGERSQLKDKKQIPKNVSKEKILQSSLSYDSNFLKSPNSTLSEKDDIHSNSKIKLQQLNEVVQTLKNRSTSRLYNIIEKIDRILSNTSRSSGDIECGWDPTLAQKTSESKILRSLNKDVEKGRTKLGKNKSAYLSNEDSSNSYVDSNTMSSDKHEVVELRTLENVKSSDWNTKERSNSANEIRSNDMYKDDLSNAFSDSIANYHKTKAYHESVKVISQESVESSDILQMSSTSNFKKDDLNSSDSAGTYIVDKNDIKSSDKNSIKILDRHLIFNDTENELNIRKRSKSGSSVSSRATFTIESEVSIPKPKKKMDLE